MKIDKSEFTIGIEEEYMLCDPISGNLVNRASIIMDEVKDKIRYSFELIESEIEANTSVHNEVSSAIEEMSYLRSSLLEIGRNYNYRLGISGTHPTALAKDQKFITNKSYNWVSNQLKYYAMRNITFSTHTHISIPDFSKSINIINALRRWIAPLLAISTNSPFFEGCETGIRSSRTLQFGAFPRTNIPEKFDKLKEYEHYINRLKEIDSIQKSRHVWWKIRPHLNLKTIEFRVCDAQRNLENIKMITSLSRALVYTAYLEYIDGKLVEDLSIEYLNDSLWKASRFGFDCKVYDEITDEIMTMGDLVELMFNYCKDALTLFNDENILDIIENILINGTECDKQLKIYKDKGMDDLKLYLMNDVTY